MDKKQFNTFCKKEFEVRGFKKIKKTFYLLGKDLLCGIDLQKSDYSNSYYINYYFFIGVFNDTNNYPVCYDLDVQGRILAMSKTQTISGKHFLTSAIEYEEYTEEELRPYFDKEFEERILPPIHKGKKYILDNLGKLYFLTLRKEEVMQKLNTGDG
ncbi:MAG: DUF4304 domain-containing protein [Ruminococcaceae bacterium]|nr:DUF4304 domain-containing protein [Oscillospiraceae bacterium]